jgi:type II secretory ATPase GspE/PulE/Tfp pilus assembly ATPase PilB-like protein
MIIAQRLVRRLCPNCKVEDIPDDLMKGRVKMAIDNIGVPNLIAPELAASPKFWKASEQGCDQCEHIGYKGRVGLYEIMRMNNEIRKMILDKASSVEIEKVAMRTGMVTLEQAGIITALAGITSLGEIYRVAKKMELN